MKQIWIIHISKRVLRYAFRRFGYQIKKINTDIRFDIGMLIRTLAAKNFPDGITIVQVGANDGISHDPIHAHAIHFGKRILLIEPQEKLLTQLTNAYKPCTGDVNIANVAISSSNDNTMNLYELDEVSGTRYHNTTGWNPTGIVSFDKDNLTYVLKHYLGMDESIAHKHIRTISVQAIGLQELLKQYSFEEVDFLQIDAEGYDWEVMKTLGSFRPTMIHFEWNLLSTKNWHDCRHWLSSEGYSTILNGIDCLAIRDGMPNQQQILTQNESIGINEDA